MAKTFTDLFDRTIVVEHLDSPKTDDDPYVMLRVEDASPGVVNFSLSLTAVHFMWVDFLDHRRMAGTPFYPNENGKYILGYIEDGLLGILNNGCLYLYFFTPAQLENLVRYMAKGDDNA